MESPRDYNSIVHSPSFTFLVGPNHTKLTIQSGLAKYVSTPLDHLMNNGQTRESKHRIAVLEDEEVETFVAFCEYAYTCDYTVPVPGSESQQANVENPWRGMFRSDSVSSIIPPPVPTPPPGSVGTPERHDSKPFHPTAEAGASEGDVPSGEEKGATTEADQQSPVDEGAGESSEPASSGKKNKKNKKEKKKQRGPAGVSFDESALNLTPPSTPPPEQLEDFVKPVGVESAAASSAMTEWWDTPDASEAQNGKAEEKEKEPEKEPEQPQQQQSSIIDTSFASQAVSTPRPKGVNIWDEFSALEYVHQRPSADTSHARTRSASTSRTEFPYLLFHAKLYVFASRYLIPALAQLCLKKLHRDLLTLSFPATSDNKGQGQDDVSSTATIAKMILDLLHYTYTRTVRYEPVSPTSPTLLRENELRKLVTHYAACKVRELAAYTPPLTTFPGIPSLDGTGAGAQLATSGGLRDLLDTTTELASDLVYRMM